MAPIPDFVGRGRAHVDEVLLAPRSPQPTSRDWLVAAALALAAIVELATSNESRWLNVVPALISVAVFPYRRQRPALAAVLALASLLALDLFTRVADIHAEITLGGSLARIALVYSVVRWSEAERRVRALLAVSILIVIWPLIDSTLLDAAIDLLAVVVVAAIAQAMRYRAGLFEEREHGERLRERNDLARELHDSVAHHVSAIAVQAQAAQFVAASDPQAAPRALVDIETIANEALTEMRRLVGILRSDDDVARSVAATSLSKLASSTSRPTVVCVGESDLEHLPRPVAAAIFRIAQEAVTNARRHAIDPTRIEVGLRTSADQALLEVRNDGQSGPERTGGFGLIGMRERAEALGGHFDAGPGADGWVVQVELPIGGP